MDHVAIMKKSLGFTEKIADGRKTIESRWYKSKRSPWDKISVGDVVYFKNSGCPVTLVAHVGKVMQFQDLTESGTRKILNEHSASIGIEPDKVEEFYYSIKDAKYCILISLENVKPLNPFEIDKKGFGLMSAWLVTPDIQIIKLS